LKPCPFCEIESARIWLETEHVIACSPSAPACDGETIVAPRKHVRTIYELTIAEQTAIWTLVADVRDRLLTGLKPDSFVIGFSDALDERAVGHAAVHVVPQWRGAATALSDAITWVEDDNLLAFRK
jgi:diadenosine tetraphosphate (Ap4A) HIT family hydrolase